MDGDGNLKQSGSDLDKELDDSEKLTKKKIPKSLKQASPYLPQVLLPRH